MSIATEGTALHTIHVEYAHAIFSMKKIAYTEADSQHRKNNEPSISHAHITLDHSVQPALIAPTPMQVLTDDAKVFAHMSERAQPHCRPLRRATFYLF
jgi:hypothetical protein